MLYNAFAKSCRRTILQMLETSQSGHPGGSLSCLDFLTVLYIDRITQTDEPVIVSNGHISPGVYSVLAECNAIDKDQVIKEFRQLNSVFEGHVTRHIPGIPYGTGPLGVGISAATGFAKAQKLKNSPQKTYCLIGDGEAQEGQVYEAALFAAKEELNNLVVFCDYNQVQLTSSLEKTMPINISGHFVAAGWDVIECNGHDHGEIKAALAAADQNQKPTLILGKTIMGYGVPLMQPDGESNKASWHGKAPQPEEIKKQLQTPELTLTAGESAALTEWQSALQFKPKATPSHPNLTVNSDVDPGAPTLYNVDENTDCRSAYGRALADLGKLNSNILGGTADLGGSVMTKFLAAETPAQFIEYGICEQNMVSASGGLSLSGYVPFCSTFGAFMSSRAKDQARVNDINATNVKMVSTHCGLSVGEDGPTHQAIDDMGSFMGMFNTHVLEPADPNHCDRLIRYAASHWGNFYIRMGRHKLPVLTKTDGTPFYDTNYLYQYGQVDLYREGSTATIVCSGPMVSLVEKVVSENKYDVEILIATSPKQFDETLCQSLRKTKKVIVVEDHNALSGYASQVALHAVKHGHVLESFQSLAPSEYQLSGKPLELYDAAGIGPADIKAAIETVI